MWRVIGAGWIALAGCEGWVPTDDPNPTGGPDAAVGDLATRGRFEVVEGATLTASDAQPFVSLGGRITTGDPRPLYTVVENLGDCRLLTIEHPPQCLPSCDGVCIADGDCVLAPRNLSAGPMTITGLQTQVRLDRQADDSYAPRDPLPDDLFSSEAYVTLTADGAEVSWFVMSAGGVGPLVTDLGAAPVQLGREDFTITWDRTDPSAQIELELRADNQFPGQPSPAILQCAAMDEGSITIPGAMLAVFPRVSATCADAECVPGRLRRLHRDGVVRSAVPIELSVVYELRFPVDHAP